MVASIKKVFASIWKSASLSSVRERAGRKIIQCLFDLDPETVFKGFIEIISKRRLTLVQSENLIINACGSLNQPLVSERVIQSFKAVSGGSLHYSQEGEDIILARLFDNKRTGFYVDVGAHHPLRFSNTFGLYQMGWRGINIDVTPGSMSIFEKLRPEDINLELAISDKKEPLTFSCFTEGALNTSDAALAQSYLQVGSVILDTIQVLPHSLAEVLTQHLPRGQKIDLMSIDVEGEDLGVLRSNDWNRFSPEVLITEALSTPLKNLFQNPMVVFLEERGFVPVSRLFNSIIFQRAAKSCAVS